MRFRANATALKMYAQTTRFRVCARTLETHARPSAGCSLDVAVASGRGTKAVDLALANESLRSCAPAGNSERLLAGLYRFIDLDSLEQTQDLLGFILACCGIENPSLRIDDFPEVSGFLDCEMF